MTSILFRNARVSRLAVVARITNPSGRAALVSQRSAAGLRRDASRPEPHSP